MRAINYFFKTTKQCNLRCLYCHEQENYKNLQILSLPLMKKIFLKILFFYKRYKLNIDLRFTYTGGEILILGKKWMHDILSLQREIFGSRGIKYTTGIQTNLTLLDQEWSELLIKNNIWISTSLDLFAKTRPFVGNKKDSASIVIDKLIMLAKKNIKPGVIIVITRHNFKKGKEIYKAMNEAGLCFHTLPLQPESIKYCPELEISPEDYAQCLIDMAEEYLKPNNRIKVTCLDGYINLVKHGYPAREGLCSTHRNCLASGPRLFFENTGEAYFCGCFCQPEVMLGNVFNDSIGKIFDNLFNKKILKKLSRRYKLIQKDCKSCEFLSICSGGCPSFAYQEGDMFSKSMFFCSLNRRFFSYLKNRLAIAANIRAT